MNILFINFKDKDDGGDMLVSLQEGSDPQRSVFGPPVRGRYVFIQIGLDMEESARSDYRSGRLSL